MGRRPKHLSEATEELLTAGDAVEVASGQQSGSPRVVPLRPEVSERREQPVPTSMKIWRSQQYAVQDEAVRRARIEGGKPDQSRIYREAVAAWQLLKETAESGRGLSAAQVARALQEVEEKGRG